MTPDNIKEYLGPERFPKERLYQTTPPGVSTGLAYTSMGGSVLFIETIIEPYVETDSEEENKVDTVAGQDFDDKEKKEKKNSRPQSQGLKVTGNLGKTMSESTEIAYSFSKGFLGRL